MSAPLYILLGIFIGGVVGAFLEWVMLLPYLRRDMRDLR